MAKPILTTDFKDDIMQEAMNGKRRYKMINNSDGTISLEDATTYDQVGSNFGAGQMNATNAAVNASADAGKIIDDIDAIRNVTKEGYMAGALALKQIDNSLESQPQFVYDEDGKITGYTTKIGGADTVFPFSNVIFGTFPGEKQTNYTLELKGLPRAVMVMQNSTYPVNVLYNRDLNESQFWFYRTYGGEKGFYNITDVNPYGVTITENLFTYGGSWTDEGEIFYVIVY